MIVSIIIPTYNEEDNISDLLAHLHTHSPDDTEIIVDDSGSDDRAVARAKEYDVNCIVSPQKGRAAQMNTGAMKAGGDILYFVNADSRPPKTFPKDIRPAVTGLNSTRTIPC